MSTTTKQKKNTPGLAANSGKKAIEFSRSIPLRAGGNGKAGSDGTLEGSDISRDESRVSKRKTQASKMRKSTTVFLQHYLFFSCSALVETKNQKTPPFSLSLPPLARFVMLPPPQATARMAATTATATVRAAIAMPRHHANGTLLMRRRRRLCRNRAAIGHRLPLPLRPPLRRRAAAAAATTSPRPT